MPKSHVWCVGPQTYLASHIKIYITDDLQWHQNLEICWLSHGHRPSCSRLSSIVWQHKVHQATIRRQSCNCPLTDSIVRTLPFSYKSSNAKKWGPTKRNYNLVLSMQKCSVNKKTGQNIGQLSPDLPDLNLCEWMVCLGSVTAILVRLQFWAQCTVPVFWSVIVSENNREKQLCADKSVGKNNWMKLIYQNIPVEAQ